MRSLIVAILLHCSISFAADLSSLSPNTWVQLKPVIDQPAKADEKGQWLWVGWNKLVYDATAKRVYFYDRWDDKKHGGYTIYGNCLFSFDPATSKLTPVKISNWYKDPTDGGGYRTKMLPENESEPTPCDRHVYYGFDYIPDLKSIFLCNGANLTVVLNGQFQSNHNTTANTWRFDLEKKIWTKMDSKLNPPNDLEDGMGYCPDTKSKISKLADCPAPLCRAALAYDLKRDLFFTVINFESKSGAQPAGVFSYDPKKDAWHEVKCTNAIPLKKAYMNAWMPICYDSANDCLLGISGESFCAIHCVP